MAGVKEWKRRYLQTTDRLPVVSDIYNNVDVELRKIDTGVGFEELVSGSLVVARTTILILSFNQPFQTHTQFPTRTFLSLSPMTLTTSLTTWHIKPHISQAVDPRRCENGKVKHAPGVLDLKAATD